MDPGISLIRFDLMPSYTPFLVVWSPLLKCFFPSWIPVSFPMPFSTPSKPPPPPQPAVIHCVQNTLSIHSFGTELRPLWTIFFSYLFMLMSLLLWKEHRVGQQTDVDLNVLIWRTCAGQLLPWVSCFFPVMQKRFHQPQKGRSKHKVQCLAYKYERWLFSELLSP